MKRFVNGEAVEFGPNEATVITTHDRLIVKGENGSHSAAAVRVGDTVHVSYRGQTYLIEKATLAAGTAVTKGDKILVLEAMKTQQPFVAPFDGVLSEVKVAKGDQVGEGALLALVVAE